MSKRRKRRLTGRLSMGQRVYAVVDPEYVSNHWQVEDILRGPFELREFFRLHLAVPPEKGTARKGCRLHLDRTSAVRDARGRIRAHAARRDAEVAFWRALHRARDGQ